MCRLFADSEEKKREGFSSISVWTTLPQKTEKYRTQFLILGAATSEKQAVITPNAPICSLTFVISGFSAPSRTVKVPPQQKQSWFHLQLSLRSWRKGTDEDTQRGANTCMRVRGWRVGGGIPCHWVSLSRGSVLPHEMGREIWWGPRPRNRPDFVSFTYHWVYIHEHQNEPFNNKLCQVLWLLMTNGCNGSG